MNELPSTICPHCDAKQLGPSEACWLCGNSLAKQPGQTLSSLESLPSREPERLTFSLATMFLLVTLASVCMGLLVVIPGWGIFACIVMVPVFIRTAKVVRHREATGQEVSSAEKALLFVTSFAVTSVLVIVVCVSAFCSFCGVCLTIVSVGGSSDDMLGWGIGMSFAAVVGLVVMVKMIKWIRRRYRRDIGEEIA